jgi:hypothetical protein
VSDPNLALAVCWGALLATFPVFTLALVGASQRTRTSLEAVA